MGGVDERGAQVEPAGGAQLGQQPLVQLLPDPDGLPVPQSPPAGHPRAAEHRWSIPPGHPGPQDEHDPGQRGSVVHRPATWIAEPSWPGRDQRCQPPPQLVSEHVVQHPTTPTAQRSPGVRPTRARCETRSYTFRSWSDGGAQTHNVTAPATPTTYTATFTTGPAVPRSMVAAAGTDGAGWVHREDARWRSISGRVIGPPAVVSAGGHIRYVVASTDGNVWMRTDLTRWAPLGPAGTSCRQPAAAVSGGTLWVGCRGSDGTLVVGTAPISTGALPG